VIGKYYRPLKTQISFRIDNEVLDCHLSRINEILRERMARERQGTVEATLCVAFPTPGSRQECRMRPHRRPYSFRNATMGSTRMARSAGR
jgi:hypothetical protein